MPETKLLPVPLEPHSSGLDVLELPISAPKVRVQKHLRSNEALNMPPDDSDRQSAAPVSPATRLSVEIIDTGLSLKARAYEALKSAIMRMDIYAQTAELRLDERDLSARFGVSRTPLREALAQLDQEGLVRIQPRRGIFIVRKTKAEILEMITVWAALESMAARLACATASDAQIAALHPLVDGFSQDAVARQLGEYSDANIAFHSAIIGLSGNALIAEITGKLFFHVRAIRRRTIVESDRAQRSVRDHGEIVAAIEQRDADRAEMLVRNHTLKLREHVERHVDLE
jgi:DNA-binding GntR family transcriptional regulator